MTRVRTVLALVLLALALATRAAAGNEPITYHGLWIMPYSTSYAIYWAPPGFAFPDGYIQFMNRYFTDVAADSGKTTNVFSVLAQYNTPYQQSFEGGFLDTQPINYPCTAYMTGIRGCVTEYGLQKEVTRFLNARGAAASKYRTVLIFFPPDLGASGFHGKLYIDYCGFHGYYRGRAADGRVDPVDTYWGLIDYGDWQGHCRNPNGQNPNGTPADSAASVASHEQAEIITDPIVGGGWYVTNGPEVADRCGRTGPTWPILGSTIYGNYSQLINGNPYNLQGEWSNASAGCVWSYP